MHYSEHASWRHSHQFSYGSAQGERNTWTVIILTVVMMVIEIVAGWLFGSMALLADGWHMGTHAAALGITVFTYRFARKHRHDLSFSFGTGKVGDLGAFASAIVLAIVSIIMIVESISRFYHPITISFNEAIIVAVIGLLVNILSAWLLMRKTTDSLSTHHHDHHGDHSHHHHHHHQGANENGADHNLMAAYFHVLADALTSLLAIVALSAGKYFGWAWMDPMMGIVGGLVIMKWAHGLVIRTSSVLLDKVPESDLLETIQERIESDPAHKIIDLHFWQLGPQQYAVILSIVTTSAPSVSDFKSKLTDLEQLVHITIELQECSCQADHTESQ